MSTATPVDNLPHPVVEYFGTQDPHESWTTGVAAIGKRSQQPYVFARANFSNSAGSISVQSGGQIIEAIETARVKRMPFVAFVHSGGVKIQEHAAALLQMPRIQQAIFRHRRAGLPSIGVFQKDVTGGARIVFGGAMQFIVARAEEPMALSGGRPYLVRVGEPIPDGELIGSAMHEKGHVDICIRGHEELAAVLETRAIEVLLGRRKIQPRISTEHDYITEPFKSLTPLERYRALVDNLRATGPDYARTCFPAYLPLREFGVVKTGVSHTKTGEIMVISHDRFTENGLMTERDMSIALHALKIARQRKMRVVTFIDCAGADPSLKNEYSSFVDRLVEFGDKFLSHPQPTAAIVIGELGSGIGAQFLGAGTVAALNGAVLTSLEPRAYAAIKRIGEEEAAAEMFRTPAFEKSRGVIDVAMSSRSYRSVREFVRRWAISTVNKGDADLDSRNNRFKQMAAFDTHVQLEALMRESA